MSAVSDELAEHWDAAHLAVYGDELQAQGDPRGELVALDLLGHGSDAIGRKTELLTTWIGAPLVARILATGSIECGFVELSLSRVADDELLSAVLASPAGPFLRTLAVRGQASTQRAMRVLAKTTHPWLSRLAVAGTSSRGQPVVVRAIADELVPALPRLESLEVSGHRVFDHLEAPHLRALRIDGGDAVTSLGGDHPVPLPKLAALDLAFGVEGRFETLPHSVIDRLLPPACFPALVALDLSRAEPGAFGPRNLGLDVDVFGWLGQREVCAQLRTLTLPSVRTSAQTSALAHALAKLPEGARVIQARRYALRDARMAAPAHLFREVGWPRPWLPPDELGGDRFSFAIAVPPSDADNACFGLPVARWLDDHAAKLSEHVLAAWGHLFGFLDRLPIGVQPFPAVVLETALAALEPAEGLAGWLRVRTLLRRPGLALPTLSVSVRRVG